MCRINALVRAAREWQEATVLKSASSSQSWKSLGPESKAMDDLRKRRSSCAADRCLLSDGRMQHIGPTRRRDSADEDM